MITKIPTKLSINLNISDIGKEMLQYQSILANTYHYKNLPKDIITKALNNYSSNLPKGFNPTREYDINDSDTYGMLLPFIGGNYKLGFEIYHKETFPLYSREGTLISCKFNRIVIGDYGTFIEIDDNDIIKENIQVKKGQEYRINDERYAKNIKYQWFTTKDNSDCKLYYQQKPVTYADYKPQKWYISPYEVLDKEELEKYISNTQSISNSSSEKLQILPKPPRYKTLSQWRKEGMCPKDSSVFEEYAATNGDGKVWLNKDGKPNIYTYISPENVIPIELKKETDFTKINLKDILCFDTETTGFSKWDEIIQLTISDGEGTELLNTYIKPLKKKSWNSASEINHIYPEDVKNSPTSKELRSIVKHLFEKAELLIGHNITFDIRMIEQCFHISLKDKQVFDTLDYFRKDVPKGSHKLINAVEYYCPEFLKKFVKGAHKSDTDVKATVKVFKKMCDIEKEIEIESNDINFE